MRWMWIKGNSHEEEVNFLWLFLSLSETEILAESQHGPGLRLNGGKILLNGKTFHRKPHIAVSIALWMNLDETDGVHSLFCTSDIRNASQYRLEVRSGRLYWFHRDKNHVVFSVLTPPAISPLKWYHVVVTYDSRARNAKVYIDGSLIAEGFGSGLLSLDWSARAGFGIHLKERPLLGFIDEIYIFRRALSAREIKKYLKNQKRKFPVSTAVLPTSVPTMIPITETADIVEEITEPPLTHPTLRPHVNSHHFSKSFEFGSKKDNDFQFDIKSGKAGRIYVYTTAKPTKKSSTTPTTNSTTVSTRTTTPTTTPTTRVTTKPTTASTTTTTTTTKSKVTTTSAPLCKYGDIFRHDDLVGGLAAGNFTDKGVMATIEDCMKLCCEEENCTVAYMISNNCFAVQCQDMKLCRTYTKSPLEMAPVIGFVDRYHNGRKCYTQL